MGFNLEKAVFDGIKEVLDANAYITANSIPVFDEGDASKDRSAAQVMINAFSAAPENCQRGPFWAVNVAITSETYIADDEDKANLYELHSEVMYEICKQAESVYTSAIDGFTVTAIIISTPTQQSLDDKYQQISLEVNFHVTED